MKAPKFYIRYRWIFIILWSVIVGCCCTIFPINTQTPEKSIIFESAALKQIGFCSQLIIVCSGVEFFQRNFLGVLNSFYLLAS